MKEFRQHDYVRNTNHRGQRIISKLRSYYSNNYPIIARRHAFIACKQEQGEPFMSWWERKMRKAQECMIMTIHNWLELELIRGISDQNLQRRLLQEKDPMLKDMISLATQWRSAETAMAQFIIDNKLSENESEPEEVNDIYYGKTPNWKKGPVTGNLDSNQDQTNTEDATQANCNRRGNAGNPTEILHNETDNPM